jgi:hypothetical protein
MASAKASGSRLSRERRQANSPPLSIQTQPRAAERAKVLRIPEPKQERVRTRYLLGQSQREISRTEDLDRGTVSRIVASDETARRVTQMRERLYGLGQLALEAVERVVRNGDGRLAYQILQDIAVVPSLEERQSVLTHQGEQSAPYRTVLLGRMMETMFARAEAYDMEPPDEGLSFTDEERKRIRSLVRGESKPPGDASSES